MKISDFIEMLKEYNDDDNVIAYGYAQDMGANIPTLATKFKLKKIQNHYFEIVATDAEAGKRLGDYLKEGQNEKM